MHFEKRSVSVLLAGVLLLAVPVVAQQEVDPDHFDSKPVAAGNQKSAPRHQKSATARDKQGTSGQISPTSKSNSGARQLSAVAKTQSVSVPTESKAR